VRGDGVRVKGVGGGKVRVKRMSLQVRRKGKARAEEAKNLQKKHPQQLKSRLNGNLARLERVKIFWGTGRLKRLTDEWAKRILLAAHSSSKRRESLTL
jgi:hypothetical protein